MGTLIGLLLALGQAAGPGALELRTLDDRPPAPANYGERKGTLVVFLSTRSEATRAAAHHASSLAEPAGGF